MPAEQRAQVYAVKGGYALRYYDLGGVRRRFRPSPPFRSKTAARNYWRDTLGPQLHGLKVAQPDRTLSEFVDEFVAAKRATVEPKTAATLTERLAYAERAFGTITLRELERRPGEIAEWAATLGSMRYPAIAALRQALDAAVRWQLISENPAKAAGRNPQPKAKEVQPFTLEQVDAIAAELGPWGPLVVFAAETGLRPEEWIALERRDVLRDAGAVLVERVVTDGRLKPYGKTARSRRRVPLTPRALDAVERVPPRLDTRIVFPAARGGYIGLDSWRSREWYPALEAAGLDRRGPYALRHTFVTNALAAGVPIFDVARYAGTSVLMIERTYGHLAKGSETHARDLLAAYSERLGQDRARDATDGQAR
jgi:integrase